MELKNSDLYKKHDQLSSLKKETYDKIYLSCINLIKKTADTGELICLFDIPKFLFGTGYPIINVPACAEYIMKKLSNANDNIKIEYVAPSFLIIDWTKDD